jgi:hypothetical protein
MSACLREAFGVENIRRAWRWIRTNPDAQFKNHFRKLYTAYSGADEPLLEDLRTRLRQGHFQPSHSTKVYYPKPSGILRPYTLLTIEDQIAYQAMTNVVAERLYPRVRRGYYKEVFGHLYAGKSSTWFYRKWSEGYRKFNAAIEDAVDSGHCHSASFDLTACYDSIDHGVLGHFLTDLRLDQGFVSVLLRFLECWTATDARIYHGHGIPQGPLSSGLVSEVVLRYFDSHKGLPKGVKYLRYVDDIRLYAKTDQALKKSLIGLDYLSRNIGLFPQSSKIRIHLFESLDDEIKTVSRPPDPVFRRKTVSQDKVHQRLVQLSPRYAVANETRFKYLLAHALPRARQSKRLLKILDRYPHLFKAIFRYFERHKTIPASVAKGLYVRVRDGEMYSAFQVSLLKATVGRLKPDYRAVFLRYVEKRWRQVRRRSNVPALQEALLHWLLVENRLEFKQIERLFCGEGLDSWVRASAVHYLSIDTLGKPSYSKVLNDMLRAEAIEPAVSAAYLLIMHECDLRRPTRDINHVASNWLKEYGVIRSRNRPPSIAQKYLRGICGGDLPDFDWKSNVGREHAQLEKLVLVAHGYMKTDMTAWINAADVLHDLLIHLLVRHDPSIGSYQLGSIGAFIGSSRSRFAKKYPDFRRACVLVHEKRKQSVLSHPVTKGTGRSTKQIAFSDLPKLQRDLRKAYRELIANW